MSEEQQLKFDKIVDPVNLLGSMDILEFMRWLGMDQYGNDTGSFSKEDVLGVLGVVEGVESLEDKEILVLNLLGKFSSQTAAE